MENMGQSLDDKTLRDIIYEECRKSTTLAEDLAHYRRVGLSHADHSYQFLRKAIERAAAVAHQDKVKEMRRKALGNGRQPGGWAASGRPQPLKPASHVVSMPAERWSLSCARRSMARLHTGPRISNTGCRFEPTWPRKTDGHMQ